MNSLINRVVLGCLVVGLLGLSSSAGAQTIDTGKDGSRDGRNKKKDLPPANVGSTPYSTQKDDEKQLLEHALMSDEWHYKVFGLFRLERFVGKEVDEHILKALKDEDWQVRCFAIRTAIRKGVEIPEVTFDEETEPRVIRIAQRLEVPIDLEQVIDVAEDELRSREPERIVLGIEIASRSGDEKLLAGAKKRLSQLLKKMNTAVLVTVGERLEKLLGVDYSLDTLYEWQNYIKRHGHVLEFPEFVSRIKDIRAEDMSPIARLDAKGFAQVIDYFDGLSQKDLELMIGIDGTGSMGGVITQAQAQTNRLMLTFNDLANSMEMGFVIFRTHSDRPMLQGQPLTDNLGKLRSFLFEVEAKGGGPKPEAIYEALGAMSKVGWSKGAVGQIIIIADEPAQSVTLPDIRTAATSFRERGIPVHCVVAGYDERAKDSFEGIAQWGGGVCIELNDTETEDLGKVIIGLLVEDKVRPSFDHLYDLYIDLGI